MLEELELTGGHRGRGGRGGGGPGGQVANRDCPCRVTMPCPQALIPFRRRCNESESRVTRPSNRRVGSEADLGPGDGAAAVIISDVKFSLPVSRRRGRHVPSPRAGPGGGRAAGGAIMTRDHMIT